MMLHTQRPLPLTRQQRPVVRTHAAVTTTRATSLLRKPSKESLVQQEKTVLDALATTKGRGKSGLSPEQLQALTAAVEQLEANGGVANPTTDAELDGNWRLLYTSRAGTASPIQNTFTGVESFSVFQEVDLTAETPRVNNIVKFGQLGFLKVEALASTTSRPLDGFTPRQDNGDFLFGIMGRSFSYEPKKPNTRIDFAFDQAAFQFSFLPFKIPYPVPFRLLGDEAKGWLDVTYLSQDKTFRLSRGNKGTLFILVKELSWRKRLKEAIAKGDDGAVLDLIEQLPDEQSIAKPARSAAVVGTWRLVWSQQAENASALQKFGSKQANSFQIITANGQLQNLVDLGPVKITAKAEVSVASDTRTTVDVTEASVTIGGLPVRLPGQKTQDAPGWVDWLYLDDEVRATRGNKGSLFVHYREEPAPESL